MPEIQKLWKSIHFTSSRMKTTKKSAICFGREFLVGCIYGDKKQNKLECNITKHEKKLLIG